MLIINSFQFGYLVIYLYIGNQTNFNMENVKQLAEEYIKLSNEEKQEFVKRIRTHWPDWECDDFVNPTTKREHIKELQEKMVQLCIDYMTEHGLDDIQEVCFSADMLQESKKYGEWTPATDSFIEVYGFQEDEKGNTVRKIIGEYC